MNRRAIGGHCWKLLLTCVLSAAAIWLTTIDPAFSQSVCTSRFSFRTDTPNSMGFSVSKLVELTKWINDSSARIFSLTISRNGVLIYELYSAGIDQNDAHYVMSVTKTFTSALVGAAIQQGKIDSDEKSIAELLPRKLFADNKYDAFKRVTLNNAMQMSALDAQVPPHLVNEETKQRQAAFLNAPNRLKFALEQNLLPRVADSDRCRPGFRDDLAHHSDLKSPTRSEMMSPTIPG